MKNPPLTNKIKSHLNENTGARMDAIKALAEMKRRERSYKKVQRLVIPEDNLVVTRYRKVK
jgi:hypothetical protein